MEKFVAVLSTLLYIGQLQTSGAVAPTSFGCYTATDPRNITVSAGNYDPSDTGSSSCFAACGELGVYQYAAVTTTDTESFCFCSQRLDSSQVAASGLCTETCSSGSADCGYYNNTFNTFEIPLMSSMQFSCDVSVNSIYGVTSCQTVASGSASYGYQMDFGTGAGMVKVSTTATKRFPIPGEYDVISYVTDTTYLSQPVSDSVSVCIQAPPTVESWLCPEQAATHEEVCCNATITAGSFLTATIDFIDTQDTIAVADTTWFAAGPAIPETPDSSYTAGTSSDLVIIDWLPFTEDGNVLFFEYLGQTSGDIDIVILTPSCTGSTTYCYETNSCSASCNAPQCTTGNMWSVAHQSCVDSSSPVAPIIVDRYANTPGDLTVKSIRTITLSTGGSQIYDVSSDPIAVTKGDIVAARSRTGTARLATRVPTVGEKGVYTSSTTPASEGDPIPSGTMSGSRLNEVYFLRAIAAKPIMLLACHTYLVPNVYSVSLNVSNSILQNHTLLNKDVNVVEGINVTVIINDAFGMANEPTVFTLEPHSGNNIVYEWFFGDGDTLITNETSVTHTYTQRGTYDVNVTAANMVSTKFNTSSITVQLRVANVDVVAEWSGSTFVNHQFYLTLSGSDYTCAWDYDDGQQPEITTELQTPTTGSVWNHTFIIEKEYNVTVNCSNDVSSDIGYIQVFTIAAIVNIKLVKTGALVNQQGMLEWTLDDGTNATCIVNYAGNDLTCNYAEATKSGSCPLGLLSATGMKTVLINCSNIVSNESLVSNFTIEEEITNAKCSEGRVNLKINESLTFNCSMDGGTSVNILWNYTDGFTDTHALNTLKRWTPLGHGEQRTHSFTYPGIFNVSATVSNNFNEFVFYVVIYVYNGFDGVSMYPNNPSSFNYGLDSPLSCVCFTSTSQYPPVDASIDLDWGDGTPIETLPFQLICFCHNYNSQNNFTVTAQLKNLVDLQIFSGVLHLVRVITNMQLFVDTAVKVNQAMTLCITLDAGDLVTLSCNFDTSAGSTQTMERVSTTPFDEDCFTYTYTTIGIRTIQCKASNPVMNVTNDYVIAVQEPVRAECYTLTASPQFTAHPAGGFTLTLTAVGGAGCPSPTNAMMKVTWQNGLYEDQPVALSAPTSWTHTYTTAGEHRCGVQLSNDVSSVDFIPPLKWCGVYVPLGVITIVPKYRPLIPIGGPAIIGYGPNNDNFPQNYPVIFEVSLSQGTVSTYIAAGINAIESAITVCDSTCGQDVSINFTSSGMYTVTITTVNPIETKNGTITIYMSDVPAGLSITTSKNVYAPGEMVIIYVTTEAMGDRTCFEVDFGDGFGSLYYGEKKTCDDLKEPLNRRRRRSTNVNGDYMGAWQPNMTLNTTYDAMSVPTVTVTAKNYVTATTPLSASFTISVSNDCDIPGLTIEGQTTLFYQAQEKQTCKAIRVKALVNIKGTSYANEKGWTIEKVDASTGNVESTVSPEGASLDTPLLYIPRNGLAYGTYKLTFRATLQKTSTDTCQSSISTYIQVTHCPLVANMAGVGITGGTFGFNKTVSLQPLHYSYDPDVQVEADKTKGISCMFKCRRVQEAWPVDSAGRLLEDPSTAFEPNPYADPNDLINNGNASGCFSQGPGMVQGTGPGNCTVSFHTLGIFPNITYTWELIMSKGQRSMRFEYNMTVTTVDDDIEPSPLDVVFRCLEGLCEDTSEGLLFRNVQNKLRLEAEILYGGPATPQSERDLNTLNYKWRLFCIGKGSSLLPIHNITDYVQDLRSMGIAIDKQLLEDKYKEYGIYPNLKVELEVSRAGGPTAVVSTTILINSPPQPGSCLINPTSGTEGLTKFTVQCSGWKDDDGIESYNLLTSSTDDNGQAIVEKKSMVTEKWTGYIGSESNSTNGGFTSVMVTVEVKDTRTGTTIWEVGYANISALSANDVEEVRQGLSNNTEKLTKLTAEGKREDIYETTEAVANQVKAIYKHITKDTTCVLATNENCEAVDALVTPLAAAQENAAEAVFGTVTNDLKSTTKKIDILSNILKEPALISTSTVGSAWGELENSAKMMLSEAGSTSQEDLSKVVDSTVHLVESLLSATMEQKEGNAYQYFLDQTPGSKEYYADNSIDGFVEVDGPRALKQLAIKRQAQIQCQRAEQLLAEILRVMSKAMQVAGVVGEEPIRHATPGNKTVFVVDINTAENILNSDIEGVKLPGIGNMNLGPDVQNTTAITATVFRSEANQYPPKNSFINQPVVNVILFTAFGELGVTNTREPIVITLPKSPPRMMVTAAGNSNNSRSGVGPMDADGFQECNATGFPLMSHAVNVPEDQTNASVLFELQSDDISAKFMVLTRCGGLNRWNATGSEDWLYGTVEYFPNENRTHNKWMLTATQMDTIFGCIRNLRPKEKLKVYSAVYQVNDTVYEAYRRSGRPAPHASTIELTASYRIKNEIIGCYFYREITETWERVEISQKMLNTTGNEIKLETNHLTAFSSGVAVAPNPIDWAFVWANADFFKNLTLYITEIVIAVLYIVAVIWARRKDMKDVEKLGLTPLIGNKPEDKYLYEIFIATGHRQNAGTESKVYLILSGDYDETEPSQVAGPGKKQLLQRGSTDGVLLATNRPLGDLNYLRVWHDNSGKGNFASWYLKYIMIQDLQTKEKYFFICDQWFAVEIGDGQVDRVIPVSGIQQMTEFSHLFSHTSQKKLGDDHLWYSVVARPPESRFSRVERVSCCLLLLFTNMLANGLFYDRAKTGTSTALSFGPFTLTLEQLYVGMITNVVIFPINFLVVTLFRKAPPRTKRKSRVKEALESQQLGSDLITEDDEKLIKEGKQSGIASPTPRSATMIELETKPSIKESSTETNKKKKFELPWWLRIIAWLLLWGGVGASAFFVTSYGIMFGDEKSKKWISSMIISFATSIFLTQPLQVVLMAMLFSAIFKKPSLDREEAEVDEEKPPLQDNEEWVLPDPEEGYLDARPTQVNYRPPDPEALGKARDKRVKELRMYDILREIVFYCIFLWLLLVVSYTFRPAIGFTLKDQVRTNFIDQGLRNNHTFMEDFMKIATHQQFWNWLNITFLPGLVAAQWYNGDWLPTSRGFLADRANRIMGYATMRQLRVKPDTCEGMALLKHLTPQCNEEYSFWTEDTDNYGPRWTPLGPNDTSTAGREHYTYRTGSEIDSYPFLAKKGFYSGGGYVVELRGSLRVIDTKIKELIQQRWIDRYTRAVFLEFTTYNPGVNLFSIITVVAECLSSGGIFPMYRVEPVTLLTHYGPMALFELAAQIAYGCFIIFFLVKEARNLHRQGRQYFQQFWNWVEMIIIFLSVAAAVIFVFRLTVVLDLTSKFKETHGNGYMKFQYAGYWQELLIYMVGWLVFLANIKFLKLLRFNRRMSMMAATLKHGAKPLFMFSIMFWIVFFAFVQFFYLIYYKDLTNFRTIVHTTETCVQMMLGRFNFEAMKIVSPYLGSIWFFIYIIACAYILINMFVSILNESFTAVRNDIALQSNDHEMVEFILGRFKDLLGIGAINDKGAVVALPQGEEWGNIEDDPDCQVGPSLDYNIEHFPQKVDRLLSCISKVYFDRNEMLGVQGAMSGPAGKAALLRLENKDEMRKMMARMMLTSFADPGNVKAIQKDFDMI